MIGLEEWRPIPLLSSSAIPRIVVREGSTISCKAGQHGSSGSRVSYLYLLATERAHASTKDPVPIPSSSMASGNLPLERGTKAVKQPQGSGISNGGRSRCLDHL